MNLNLEDVFNLGPAKRVIKVLGNDGNEYEADIFLRPLSFDLIMRSAPDDDQDAVRDLLAERISYSVCNEKGEPIFTKEQVKGTAPKSLNGDMVLSLMTVVNEFHGIIAKKENPEGK